jgi:peptidoglycan/xylan/chitin deacetylase (PgdA/CDA1 family)
MDVVTLSEFCKLFLTGKASDRPTAVIVFRRGLAETVKVAAPILYDFNLPATVFLPPKAVGTAFWPWPERTSRAACRIHERRDELMAAFPDENMPESCAFVINLLVAGPRTPRFVSAVIEQIRRTEAGGERETAVSWLEWLGRVPEPERGAHLDWDQVRSLAERGWDVGCDAPGLSGLEMDGGKLEADLIGSVRTIQGEVGHSPVGFFYPRSADEDQLARLSRKAGVLCGLIPQDGYADAAPDLFHLPAIQVSQENAPNAETFETLLSFL